MKEACWLRGLWWTLQSFVRSGWWSPTVDGHVYRDDETHVSAWVTTSRCVHCGRYSVSWSRQ